MSIAAATRNAYAAEVREQSPEFRAASGATTNDSPLEQVAEWIPAEALGIYIALLGLFTPEGDGRWVLFIVGVIAVAVIALMNSAITNKRAQDAWDKEGKPGNAPKLSGSKLGLVIAISLLAFLTYAWALPATPFADWVNDATIIGGAAAIVLAPFLPKIAELAGIKPPTL